MALFKIQQAVNMFSQNNEQAGISTLKTLLFQPKLPPFWRIHALALLAHSVDDWLEAKVSILPSSVPSPESGPVHGRTTLTIMQKYQRQAETLWQLSRRLLAAGVDDEYDRTLHINRGFLDQLAVEMVNEMPDEIRGLLDKAKAESEQGAIRDNETSDNDGGELGEGRADGLDNGLDNGSDDNADEDSEEGYEGDDEDNANHDEEEQKVETMEISDCSFDDVPSPTPEGTTSN